MSEPKDLINLKPVGELLDDVGLSDQEKFYRICNYFKASIEPEIRKQELLILARKSVLSDSDPFYRIWDLQHRLSEGLAYLYFQPQVPREKWADLCPLFLEAIRESLASEKRITSSNMGPNLSKAIEAAWNRRLELGRQGYFDALEMEGWGRFGG